MQNHENISTEKNENEHVNFHLEEEKRKTKGKNVQEKNCSFKKAVVQFEDDVDVVQCSK